MTAPPDTLLKPPRWASLLLRAVLRDDRWREITLGDLAEEFNARAQREGGTRARRWYGRQARSLTRAALMDLLRGVSHPLGGRHMSSYVRELGLAFRALVHQPLMTLLVVATLAIALGANAATFGMIDALALRPFTFPGVDRLVVLSENSADDPFPQQAVAPATLTDLNARPLQTLGVLAGMEWWDVNVSGDGEPERLQGTKVSSAFFSLLGQSPAEGRFFLTAEERLGTHRAAVISHGLWMRRFGGRSPALGQTLRLDGEPFVVVGIAPKGFDFPNGTEIWTPLAFSAEEAAVRRNTYLTVIGRLRDDATLQAAQAEVGAIYTSLARAFPAETRGRSLVVRTLTAAMVDFGLPRILTLWQAAAVLVLLIACVNVANLLLARGAERRQELAVRLAIGAGRAQIVRQLLIESVVLAAVAVPAALGVAWLAFRFLRTTLPAELIRFVAGWESMGVDWRVAGVTFVAACLAAVIFGLLPALQVSRPDLTSTLRDNTRSATAGAARSRLRRALVVGQVGLAMPLLVMAGLSVMAAQRFGSGPQGYDPSGVVRLATLLPDATYPDAESRRQFVERLLDQASRVPRVESVSTTTSTPATGGGMRRDLVIDGQPRPEGDLPRVNYRIVSPEYFAVMRIPIQEGRAIGSQDGPAGARVVVISRSLARRHWPGESAIGRRVKFGREAQDWFTVVGIAGDTIDDWFMYRHEPTAFVAASQAPSSGLFLVARAADGVDPATLIADLRTAVWAADRDQAVFDVATMPDAIRQRTTGLRVIGQVMAAFGGVAVLLAAFGIYGVMAHYVAVRQPEIGVRLALGATARDVLRLTLGQAAKLAAIGLALGLALAVALARLMETFLFGVVAVEPALFAAIAGGLALLALAASIVPARRAMGIDPVRAMRS